MVAERQNLEYQLKKILESDQFSRSNVNKVLLSLLFRATIEGRKLKEATIGSEIFGNSYDPVKNDNKVRVYIHNLRRKLSAYYETEGQNDKVIFQIEKGEYRVVFKDVEEKKSLFSNSGSIVGLSVLLLFFIGAFFFFRKKTSSDFWEGFLDEKFSITVLIGDHFTIESNVPTGGFGTFRDFSINSEQDFTQHLQQHPEQASQMVPNQYPYVTKMGPYSAKMLSQYFGDHGTSFDLLLNSEWDKSKINTENLVYVGQFKTMGFLKNVFTDYFPNYEIIGEKITRRDFTNNDKETFRSRSGNQIIDYTIVSKMHGPVDNDIVMFLSDNDIGVIRMVEYFTDKDSIAAFYNRQQLLGKDFAALFKVSGWERTGYTMELIKLDIK
ncbi:helix-turn-helix domain-containing protein [uncultured Sunxiuqinia sp.]|uniref:helix-turn-helix domain-containing protein n=1 Tax=uncultured Sunxiuqinia sp. TaxID=1573825 RepID=UPI002AA8E333|nr:helix-turn-helix domain-containing protein [uncultured Sunxiuqinia sp.]